MSGILQSSWSLRLPARNACSVLIWVLLICVLQVESFASGAHAVGEFPYRLRRGATVAVLSSGLTLSATGLMLDAYYHLPTAEEHGLDRFDRNSVPAIDRATMRPYSEFHHNASHAMFALAMLAPVPVMVGQERSVAQTVAVMYGQTLLLSFGLKRTLVHVFPRYRPQSYFGTGSSRLHQDQNTRKSFPSGHTAHPFAAATFATTVFSAVYPDSRYRYAIAAGTYGVAASVATLRVMAGKHFLSDVVAGAALGSFAGWLVPRLYRAEREPSHEIRPLLDLQGAGVLIQVPFRPRA